MLGIEIDRNRIFGLDFLRALAIFFVVHGHGSFLLSGSRISFLNAIPFPDVVDIFFVLTGFLIGGSFLSYAQKHDGVDFRKTLRFYGRTFLRILPNYYVILIINYLLVEYQLIPGNTQQFPIWQFATFTQNLFTPFYGFFWESWCLPVQWWFYILFPLLLVLFSKRGKMKCLVPVICLAFVAFSIGYRIVVFDHAADNFWWGVWIRKTVASRVDCIYIGVLVAWVRMYAPDFWSRHAVKSLVAGLILMLIVILLPQHPGTWYKNVVSSTLQAVSFALLLPYAASVTCCRTVFGKIVSHISVLSYSMYLVNLLVAQLIVANFADRFQSWGAWGYVVYWIMVVIASYTLYIIVERPFDKLRTKI